MHGLYINILKFVFVFITNEILMDIRTKTGLIFRAPFCSFIFYRNSVYHNTAVFVISLSSDWIFRKIDIDISRKNT
jgi:hypothetical protein